MRGSVTCLCCGEPLDDSVDKHIEGGRCLATAEQREHIEAVLMLPLPLNKVVAERDRIVAAIRAEARLT